MKQEWEKIWKSGSKDEQVNIAKDNAVIKDQEVNCNELHEFVEKEDLLLDKFEGKDVFSRMIDEDCVLAVLINLNN